MTKTTTTLLLVFTFLSTYSQNIANTEWVKIKAEKIDGSRIISSDSAAPLSLYFLTDSVLIGLSHEYRYKQSYSVDSGIIFIGAKTQHHIDSIITMPDGTSYVIGIATQYHIDSISDIFLVASQLDRNNPNNDSLNRYLFINGDYLFDYLKQNNKLTIIGDTLVVCNDNFSPTYIGDIVDIILKEMPYSSQDIFIDGSIILSATGNIERVEIDTSTKSSNKIVDRIIRTLYETKASSWVLPPTPIPLKFKIKFDFQTHHLSTIQLTSIHLIPSDASSGPTKEQILERNKHFNKGIVSMNKGNFDIAASEFKQCITIDETDLDAYYDLAYAYQKMGDTTKACEVWKKLKDMGQKKGEALCDEFCK